MSNGKGDAFAKKNTLYDLDLVVKVTYNVVQYPPNNMTYAHAKFEAATSNSLQWIYKKEH